MPVTNHVARIISLCLRAGVGLAIAGAAMFIVTILMVNRVEPETADNPDATLTVRAVRVREMSVSRVWEGYGTAEARFAADLSAQVSGRVVERPRSIEPGAPVRQDDLIIRIDPTDYALRLQTARESLAQMLADLEAWEIRRQRIGEQVELMQAAADVAVRESQRASNALESGGANLLEVEAKLAAANRALSEVAALRQQYELMLPERASLQSRIDAQRAAIRLAEEDLARTEIRAPFSGSIQRIAVKEGELIAVGSPVVRVVDLSLIETPVRLPLSAAGSVGIGDEVELMSDSPLGRSWRGTIARVAPEADPATRTITVFVQVEQDPVSDGLLLPGGFVLARVHSRTLANHVVIPRKALTGSQVFEIDENGRVALRDVEVAFHADDRTLPGLASASFSQWTVIARGLTPGELVAVSNLDQLEPDQVVNVDEQRLAVRILP